VPAPPRSVPARVGGSVIAPDFSSFFRMVLVMASRAKRSAIVQIVPQLRKCICMLYVVSNGCLGPPAITSALFTEITSPSKDRFSPFFVTFLVVKLRQTITPQTRNLRKDKQPTHLFNAIVCASASLLPPWAGEHPRLSLSP